MALNTFLQVGHEFKIALNTSEGLGCDEGLCQQSCLVCTAVLRARGDCLQLSGLVKLRDAGINAVHLHAAIAEIGKWRSSHSFMNHHPFCRRTRD